MVWYNSGWKYAVTPTPTAVGGTWTWDEAKDVVLGQFIEPGSEQDLVEAYLYNPPRTAAQVKTTNPSPYQYSQSAVEWYNSNGQTTVNANTMLAAWADGAFSATTEIDGGFIKAHTIQAEHLATDAIMSNNFQASSVEGSPFSAAGTFLDLTTGNLYSPNFGIDNSYGVAYLNGEIIATSGRIGASSSPNYWEIDTKIDYNQQPSAAMIGHGRSYIQSGEWQLSNNRLDTRSYNAQNQITYPYANSTYYDFGINMPTLDVTLDPTSPNYSNGVDNSGHNDNFIYIRTAENSIPSFETNWNYVFRIDKNGMIWINGQSLDQKYASIDGVTGTYLPLTGGTVSGNLTVNGTLTAIASQAAGLTHSLTINGTAWDGSTSTTIGTMGVAYGGTGRNTLTSGSALIGNGTSAVNFRAITNNTSATYITANDNLITANTLKFWKGSYDSSNNSNIEYVKLGKLGTAATHAMEDFITVGGGVIDGSLSVTDLTAGSLIVNGAARFVNGAIGDLTGNASTATTLATARTIQTNLASTSAASFNGSANVTPGVTGTLGVANGGTGQTSAKNAANAFMNALDTGSSTPVDADYYISQYVNGGTTTTTYHRRPMSALWTYVNGKISSVLGLTSSAYGGNAASANQVNNNLIIKLASGTTEGTNMFTYNGSAGKTVNLGAAAAKSVDTSIAGASTSANLPTSAAVASFVENKGYVTSSGVTSVSGTSPVSASGTTSVTISLANGYGDTKNPYGSDKAKNLVLATPKNQTGAPSFRALDPSDIPTLSLSKISDTSDLAAIEALTGTSGFLKKTAANTWSLDTNSYIKGVSNPTNGNFVTWGANGTTVADSGYAPNQVVKSLASDNNGKLVLTYLDNSTSAPIEVMIIGSSGSSVSFADALNVNGTAIGSTTQPVYFNNQGKPVVTNSIPKLNNGTSGGTFYAPTSVGTNGYILKSGGSGAPSWVAQSTLSVGSATNATNATNDADGNAIASTYLKKSGGTMTGKLTLQSGQYADSYSTAALDLQNSNIVGVNSIYTADASDSPQEGIHFYRDATHVDTLYAQSGKLYFTPNRAIGSNGTSYEVFASGSGSTVPEAWLSWGGRNFSASYGCIDAAMVPDLGANRLAYISANSITIEYSRDGGNTWTDYGANDTQKVGLFSTGYSVFIGKADSNNKATEHGSDYQLRVTIDTGLAPVYTTLNKFVIYVSTNGSTGCKVKIQKALQSTPTTFVDHTDFIDIAGWSGYNVINTNGLTTYGNTAASQYGRVRFLFTNTNSGASTNYSGLNVMRIMGFGGVGWTCPSNMARNGHLYAMDSAQNATFPAQVTATQFNGYFNGIATSSYYPRIVASNEIRFDVNSKPSSTTSLYVGYKWSDGTSDAKINRYIFYNGNAQVTDVQASTFYGALSGNASTATKFNSARSISLTGDTTGTASSDGTSGWSITSTTKYLTNNGRLTSANVDNSATPYLNKVAYFLASSSMTEGKPPEDCGVLNLAWDNATWGGQIAMRLHTTPHLYIRGSSNSAWDENWLTVLDSNNFNTYAPKKDGTGATGTWGINISGNAAKDGSGNTITSYYCTLATAQTISGTKTFSTMPITNGISVVNSTNGTSGGIALYSTTPTAYGIAMRTTNNGGKHGYVQGDWAIYSYMTGSDSTNKYTRGWIFKNASDNVGVASISGAGNAAFNGSVTIGANTDNTSGCRLVMDNTLKCLNFVFA